MGNKGKSITYRGKKAKIISVHNINKRVVIIEFKNPKPFPANLVINLDWVNDKGKKEVKFLRKNHF
jgi:hypothetical protein